MKIIINNSVYEMTKQQAEKTIKVASQYVPFGIYAVEKDGIIELRKDKCKTSKHLNQLKADFIRNGFKVYSNEH